ncbi:hypothetical protein VTO73DRAFT_7020 [Trametes versicolor]
MALARLIIALPTLSALRLQEVSWAKIGAMPCNSPFVKRGWLKLRHIAIVGSWKLLPGLSVLFGAADPKALRSIVVDYSMSEAGVEADYETFLRFLAACSSLETITATRVRSVFSAFLHMHFVSELLVNLPPARCLDRFVVDLAHSPADPQRVLQEIGDLSDIIEESPRCPRCLEIRVLNWSMWRDIAPEWHAKVAPQFSAAALARVTLEVVVLDRMLIYEGFPLGGWMWE